MKKNSLIIIGAGGHGKVIADIAIKLGYTDIKFVDDNLTGFCMDFPIVGKTCDITALNKENTDFVIGVGNNGVRKKISESYNVNWVTLIHPSAQISINVDIGVGSVIMALAVVNANTTIGKHCIINSCSVVEHDNIIEDFVHISPKAALGGAVHVGKGSHVGIGSTVKNGVSICDSCIIGAGAVLVKNADVSGIYIGVPAKRKT